MLYIGAFKYRYYIVNFNLKLFFPDISMKRQEPTLSDKTSPLLLYQQAPQNTARNIGTFTPIQNDFSSTWPNLVVPYRPPAIHQLNFQQQPHLPSQLFNFPNVPPSSSTMTQTNSSRSFSNHSDEDSLGKTSEVEEEYDEDTKNDAKKMLKRNPYSIEELLKKPSKLPKNTSNEKNLRFIHPPCRIIVDEPCNCTLIAHPISTTQDISTIHKNKNERNIPLLNSAESKNHNSF